jgi:hypothetical protein
MILTLPSRSVTIPVDEQTIENVKRTLGKETEKLAELASQYGRGAGATLVETGRRATTDLGQSAHGWADKLREMRDDGQVPSRAPSALSAILLLAALTIGFALIYLFATARGRKSRQRLTERLEARAKRGREEAAEMADELESGVAEASPDADTAAWPIPVVSESAAQSSSEKLGEIAREETNGLKVS